MIRPGLIRFVEETGSTNADLAAAIRRGDPPVQGKWLVARRQKAGRGRQGRTWHDGAGNFMGSTVIRLGRDAPAAGTYAFPISVALYQSVERFVGAGEPLMLKWPNDLLLRGAKVSGVLMELIEDSLIVGIGVNLARAPRLADRATIALAEVELCEELSLELFAETLAEHVASAVALFEERHGEARIREMWLERAHPPGTPLTVDDGAGNRISGRFSGLSPSGALMLQREDGAVQCVRAGDVLLAEKD